MFVSFYIIIIVAFIAISNIFYKENEVSSEKYFQIESNSQIFQVFRIYQFFISQLDGMKLEWKIDNLTIIGNPIEHSFNESKIYKIEFNYIQNGDVYRGKKDIPVENEDYSYKEEGNHIRDINYLSVITKGLKIEIKIGISRPEIAIVMSINKSIGHFELGVETMNKENETIEIIDRKDFYTTPFVSYNYIVQENQIQNPNIHYIRSYIRLYNGQCSEWYITQYHDY